MRPHFLHNVIIFLLDNKNYEKNLSGSISGKGSANMKIIIITITNVHCQSTTKNLIGNKSIDK